MTIIFGANKTTTIVNMKTEPYFPFIYERTLDINIKFGVKALNYPLHFTPSKFSSVNIFYTNVP